MKLNTTIKTLCAALALAGSAAASAGQIYLDNGINAFVADDAFTPTTTSTSLKNELTLDYKSTTILNFATKTFTTTFGWDQLANNGNLAQNIVTGFDPNQVGLTTSSNNYGLNVFNIPVNGWALTFAGTASGTFDYNGGNPILNYTAGHLDMFYLDATLPQTNGTWAYTNFMDVEISGGLTIPGNTKLNGRVTFDGTTASSQNDLFHSLYKPNCAASDSFVDIAAGCGDDAPIFFSGDFNTYLPTGTPISDYEVMLTGEHNGSARFDVPEPASLALLGMGLVGLGAIRRRKIAA